MTEALSKFDNSELLKEVFRRYVVELFGIGGLSSDAGKLDARTDRTESYCERPVLTETEHEPPSSREQDAQRLASHSADFASVNWYGKNYTFAPTQARCVEVLWEAWDNGTPALCQHHILERADSESKQLGYLFKKHAAWGSMIVRAAKGTYQLKAPVSSTEEPGE